MRVFFLIIIELSLLYADIIRDNTVGIVVDTRTNLVWQDHMIYDEKTWLEAIGTCENLELGGYDDWRLPNVNELTSILDRNQKDLLIKDGFVNTELTEGGFGSTSVYWTSTTNERIPSNAWIILFHLGTTTTLKKGDKYYFRCVRGGFSEGEEHPDPTH